MNEKEIQVREALEGVMDPELNISIVDLGLIYEIHDKPDNKLEIIMTLTTLGCPLFNVIERDIKNAVAPLGYSIENVEIELVFDPPWSMERMSESAKAMLGI